MKQINAVPTHRYVPWMSYKNTSSSVHGYLDDILRGEDVTQQFDPNAVWHAEVSQVYFFIGPYTRGYLIGSPSLVREETEYVTLHVKKLRFRLGFPQVYREEYDKEIEQVNRGIITPEDAIKNMSLDPQRYVRNILVTQDGVNMYQFETGIEHRAYKPFIENEIIRRGYGSKVPENFVPVILAPLESMMMTMFNESLEKAREIRGW